MWVFYKYSKYIPDFSGIGFILLPGALLLVYIYFAKHLKVAPFAIAFNFFPIGILYCLAVLANSLVPNHLFGGIAGSIFFATLYLCMWVFVMGVALGLVELYREGS